LNTTGSSGDGPVEGTKDPLGTAKSVDGDHVARGGAIMLAMRAATQLVQFVVTLGVARILAPSDYGLIATAYILTGFIEVLATAGMGRALVQSEKLGERDVAETFTLMLALSIAACLVTQALAAPFAAHLNNPLVEPLVRALALLILVAPFQAICFALIERRLQYGRITAMLAVVGLIQATTLLTLAVLGFGVWALAVSMIVGTILTTLWLLIAANWRPRLAMPTREVKPLLMFGLTVAATHMLWFVYRYADLAIITFLLNTVQLGYYWLALQIMSVPAEKIVLAVNQIAYPAYSRMQDDARRMQDWFARAMLQVSLFTVPALVGFALVADDAVKSGLGDQWQGAVLPAQILVPTGILMTLSALFSPFLNAIGRPEISLRYTGASVAIMPPAFFIGGYFYGIIGVCIAWSVAYPLVVFGLVHLTRHLTGLGVLRMLRLHWPIAVATLAMAIAVLAIRHALPAQAPEIRVLASVASGGISYVLTIALFARNTILRDTIYAARSLIKRKPPPKTLLA